jgi:hypothetical protein
LILSPDIAILCGFYLIYCGFHLSISTWYFFIISISSLTISSTLLDFFSRS